MEEITLGTMIAVFEATFGRGVFWALVVGTIVLLVAYVYVLIRDRSKNWRKFLIAQLFMPVGAVAAVWFVMAITNSRMADIGGPIDVIILLAIAMVGAVGGAILVYTVQALLFHGPRRDGREGHI